MKSNVGTIDRGIRIALGILLILLAALEVIGPWGYAGLLLVLTGAFRFCPAYPLLGITTCSAPAPGDKR
ncbi:DUF2892 domain-containing protein [Caenimonas sedimenti]|uniref:DUF2892 domain-containing protein n=1 Tax=Caenimonas sedimenti TaxID=2596921 RepID=A0A562ZWL8_9BURK|nr:DUF2892 domain-containing protein [Caenimonas sedimenti]TWO72708.1 DUF2892 domain-containing protein [Caenimonas sedimenti]